MANDKIHFLTGELANLPTDKLVSGQVYFAIDPQNTPDRGYIYFDTKTIDASTKKESVKRFLMGSPYANAWTSAKSFGITDGEHQTKTTDLIAVDGSQDLYLLHLPESINIKDIHSTGTLFTTNGSNKVDGTVTTQIKGTMANNDYWRIGSGGSASDGGFVEFATADNGNEPIYIRQYNGNFATLTRTLTLLDASGNTTLPGVLTVQNRAVINNNLNVGGVLSVTGNTALSGNLTVAGTASITNTLTLGNNLIIESAADSLNSTADAALVVTGGASIGKQLSAKSVRIDNNQISKGCTLKFDEALNCVEFVFD